MWSPTCPKRELSFSSLPLRPSTAAWLPGTCSPRLGLPRSGRPKEVPSGALLLPLLWTGFQLEPLSSEESGHASGSPAAA